MDKRLTASKYCPKTKKQKSRTEPNFVTITVYNSDSEGQKGKGGQIGEWKGDRKRRGGGGKNRSPEMRGWESNHDIS